MEAASAAAAAAVHHHCWLLGVQALLNLDLLNHPMLVTAERAVLAHHAQHSHCCWVPHCSDLHQLHVELHLRLQVALDLTALQPLDQTPARRTMLCCCRYFCFQVHSLGTLMAEKDWLVRSCLRGLMAGWAAQGLMMGLQLGWTARHDASLVHRGGVGHPDRTSALSGGPACHRAQCRINADWQNNTVKACRLAPFHT